MGVLERPARALLLVAAFAASARADGPGSTAEQGASFADDAALARALAPFEVPVPEMAFDAVDCDDVGTWAFDGDAGPALRLRGFADRLAHEVVARLPAGAERVVAVDPARTLAVVLGAARAGPGPVWLAPLGGGEAFALPEQVDVRAAAADGALVVLAGPAGAVVHARAPDGVWRATSLAAEPARAVALRVQAPGSPARVALAFGDGRLGSLEVAVGPDGAPRATGRRELPAGGAAATALELGDGRLAVGREDGQVELWADPGAPASLEVLAIAPSPTPPGAPPRRWLAVKRVAIGPAGGPERVLARSAAGHAVYARSAADGARLELSRRGTARLGALAWGGLVALRPVDLDRLEVRWRPLAARLRVGEDEVASDAAAEVRAAEAGPSSWPRLVARARWDAGVVGDGAPEVSLEVEVQNLGGVAATWLVSRLEADPPDAVAAPPLHLGALAPGATARRRVRLARGPGLDRGDVRLTLRWSDPGDVVPPAVAWQHLPRVAGDAEAFDALARRVHALTVEVLRDALDDPGFDPALERLPPGAIGFMTGHGDAGRPVLRYQNPFLFEAAGWEGNRRATGAPDLETLRRDAELMLWWFLPHEAAHAARMWRGRFGQEGWVEEWVAAALQPALVARVLARAGDRAPYGADAVLRAVARWADALEASVPAPDRARIAAWAAGAGAPGAPADAPGRTPDPRAAFQVFRDDVGRYVHVLSRASLAAAARADPFEDLVARLLRR